MIQALNFLERKSNWCLCRFLLHIYFYFFRSVIWGTRLAFGNQYWKDFNVCVNGEEAYGWMRRDFSQCLFLDFLTSNFRCIIFISIIDHLSFNWDFLLYSVLLIREIIFYRVYSIIMFNKLFPYCIFFLWKNVYASLYIT